MDRSLNSPWVVPYFKPDPRARIRLFCIPYAGGGGSIFSKWLFRFPPELEIVPVLLPGRETRLYEACILQARDVASEVVRALRPMFDRSFALFGDGLGALIAYEIAQNLQRAGEIMPKRLIVSAQRAPHLRYSMGHLWNLPEPEFRTTLWHLGHTPKVLLDDKEFMEVYGRMLRADFHMDECYVYDTQDCVLTCPITAVGGIYDDYVSEPELRAWSKVTRCGFDYQLIDGDHFFIKTREDWLIDSLCQLLLPGCYTPRLLHRER